MAIMAEELYSVNASVTLTMLGTVLGVLPILIGGTPEQCSRLLRPFLKKTGAPLAGFCSSEPGGSANAASPPPGRRRAYHGKTPGRRTGSSTVAKSGFRRRPVGTAREQTSCASYAERTPMGRPKSPFRSLRSNDPRPASCSNVPSIRSVTAPTSRPSFACENVAAPRQICWGRRVAALR